MAITVDLADVPLVLALIGQKIDENITSLIRISILAAGDAMVRTTAVDTGEARSNWTLSIGSTFVGTRPPYHPYLKLYSSFLTAPRFHETRNLQAAVDAMDLALQGFTDHHTQRILTIANSVDHILELEDGTASPQSPQGMTRFAFPAFRSIFVALAPVVLARGLP